MPQETKSKFEPGAATDGAGAGGRPASLQGLVVTREDEVALLKALESAFDYRGDVTVTLVNGAVIEGYIFDRVRGATLDASYVRLLGPASDEKIRIAFSDIAGLAFSGRDTAAGKTFEAWIKRYIEKKMAGEKASIESDALD